MEELNELLRGVLENIDDIMTGAMALSAELEDGTLTDENIQDFLENVSCNSEEATFTLEGLINLGESLV